MNRECSRFIKRCSLRLSTSPAGTTPGANSANDSVALLRRRRSDLCLFLGNSILARARPDWTFFSLFSRYFFTA